MADPLPGNPSPNSPPQPTLALPPPPVGPAPPLPPPPPPPPCDPIPGHGGCRFFSVPRPALRVTTEYDSESSIFFHKFSCKLFDNLAKLKFSFQKDGVGKGPITFPQLGLFTKRFSVLYDLESRNALLKGSVDVADFLQIRATHDVKASENRRIESSLLSDT